MLGELVVALVVVLLTVWVPVVAGVLVIWRRAGGAKMLAEVRGQPLKAARARGR